MADVIGMPDVSIDDTGKGSQLKTGKIRKGHNMPADCVKKNMANGMSKKAAMKECYPAGKKGSMKRAVKGVQASIGGMKGRKALKKQEKKGSLNVSY